MLITQPLGNVEDEGVGALFGDFEIALCLLPPLLGDLLLLFRHSALRHGLTPVDLGPYRKAGQQECRDRESSDPALLPAAALAHGATEDVVRGNVEKPRHDLGQCEALAVSLVSRVCGQEVDWIASDLSLRVGFERERPREAFELGIARLAGDDQRDHRPLRVPRFEEPDLLVDVGTLRRGWRADHNQRG